MSKMIKTNKHTIDEYLSLLPADKNNALQRVRDIVNKLVPGCEERVSYGVPIISFGKDLIGFSAQKDFCSFYTMSPPLAKSLSTELKDFKISGATIHFSPDKPLPESLIKKIVERRLKENSGKTKTK